MTREMTRDDYRDDERLEMMTRDDEERLEMMTRDDEILSRLVVIHVSITDIVCRLCPNVMHCILALFPDF